MTGEQTLILAILGGILGLDTVSFPQAMLSRPIVAGTLAGALMGDPLRGVFFGATLELFALETLPFGASRYPEWGSAAAVGGGLYALLGDNNAGTLATSVTIALAVAWLGSWSMVQLRKLNAVWARARHDEVARGSRSAVVGLQLRGLLADLLRAIALTALGIAAGSPLQEAALARFHSQPALSRSVVVALAAAVALGAVWKIFHATPKGRWLFLAGLAGGVSVAVLR
jgi:mannose/fructose/N-acetylgalactosamine-specific phosphotransferase system component IIC